MFRRPGGGDRPRLDDPELPAVVAPLDVLGHAVVLFDARDERAELRELRGRQRRHGSGALPGRADPRRQHCRIALVDAEFIGIDQAAHERLAEPASGVDHELVGAGDGVDRERHA